MLSQSDHDYTKPLNKAKPSFLHFRNSGNLKIPSEFVVNVVKYAEHIFKLYIAKQALDQICLITNLKKKMVLEVCQHFAQDATTALSPRHERTDE